MTAILWLPMRSQFWADNGVQLLTDGDCEQIGVAAWTVFRDGQLTKNTSFPHSGAQYLRVTTGALSYPGAMQNVCTNLRRYHFNGWYSGNGVRAPFVNFGSSKQWDGTNSTTWQYRDVVDTADGTNFTVGVSVGAGGGGDYCRFDDWSLQEQFMYTANLGSLKGKVQLGDGRTSTKFPSQLARQRGMNFDGGDYINIGSAGNLTDNFTIWCAISEWSQRLLTRRIGADTQYDWFIHPATGTQNLYNGAFTITGSRDLRKGFSTLACTFSGGVLTMYVNGVYDVSSGGINITAQNVNTVFGACDGEVNFGAGKAHGVAIWPYVLTPTQLRDLHYRAALETNQP